MIFCPAAWLPDETAQMIYGGWLVGSSAGSSVFRWPLQTQTKLGYSENVKGLSRTNKCNQGLPPLQVVLILLDYRGLSSVPVSFLQTQM